MEDLPTNFEKMMSAAASPYHQEAVRAFDYLQNLFYEQAPISMVSDYYNAFLAISAYPSQSGITANDIEMCYDYFDRRHRKIMKG